MYIIIIKVNHNHSMSENEWTVPAQYLLSAFILSCSFLFKTVDLEKFERLKMAVLPSVCIQLAFIGDTENKQTGKCGWVERAMLLRAHTIS